MSPAAEAAKKHFEDILTFFGINASVQASQDGDTVELSVQSESSGHLIGYRGRDTLGAPAHYQCNHQAQDRRSYLHSCRRGRIPPGSTGKVNCSSPGAAARVVETGEEEALPGMNANERRHIHALLGESRFS